MKRLTIAEIILAMAFATYLYAQIPGPLDDPCYCGCGTYECDCGQENGFESKTKCKLKR